MNPIQDTVCKLRDPYTFNDLLIARKIYAYYSIKEIPDWERDKRHKPKKLTMMNLTKEYGPEEFRSKLYELLDKYQFDLVDYQEYMNKDLSESFEIIVQHNETKVPILLRDFLRVHTDTSLEIIERTLKLYRSENND